MESENTKKLYQKKKNKGLKKTFELIELIMN